MKIKNRDRLFKSLLAVVISAGLFISAKTLLSAPVPLQVGDVSGFAWMGTNVTQPPVQQSEGGGGWLKFNCRPNDCVYPAGSNQNWGTSVILDHSINDGNFVGQAWSNNYGWLSFDFDAGANECWQNISFPGMYGQTTKALMSAAPDANGNIPVVGWARFIGGTDFPNDGWDGCVYFGGGSVPFGVKLNLNSGVLSGFAWGGDVVGWISFANPQCPSCNPSVVLPDAPTITFWADQTSFAQAPASTVLHWQANNNSGGSVASCPTYSNTSGYSHWQNGGSTSPNAISTGAGNLPVGQHQISAIGQTTTYALNCVTDLGNALPTQYVTITIGAAGPVNGCTDPAATNYNPLATVNDGSCIYVGGSPALQLSATPGTQTQNSSGVTTLQWTSNITTLNSCTGSANFIPSGGTSTSVTIPGWANPPNPNSSMNVTLNTSVVGQYRFRISCMNGGTPINSNTAVVNIVDQIISGLAPSVTLAIKIPEGNPPGGLREDLAPTIGADVTLEWFSANVSSCSANSDVFEDNGVTISGTNTSWNGSKTEDGTFDQVLGMTISSGALHPTRFYITCVPDDTNISPITREVCVGLQGVPFQACGVVGDGGIPSYQEI